MTHELASVGVYSRGAARLSIVAVWFIMICPVAVLAADRIKSSSADAIDREVRKELTACTRRAVADADRQGGVVVPGLKSCYDAAAARWEAVTAPITEKLLAATGSDCARAVEAMLQEWEQYSTRLTELPAVQDMPINTDDDLRLVLRKHLYETMLAMTANVQCPQ